jgi:hypothetical protein
MHFSRALLLHKMVTGWINPTVSLVMKLHESKITHNTSLLLPRLIGAYDQEPDAVEECLKDR